MNNRLSWACKIYLFVSDVITLNVSAIRSGISVSTVFQSYSDCGTVPGTKVQICK